MLVYRFLKDVIHEERKNSRPESVKGKMKYVEGLGEGG
jgi:hypothetical protein